MRNEPFSASFAVVNVQPRFSVVLPELFRTIQKKGILLIS